MPRKAIAINQEVEGEKKLTLLDIASHIANLNWALESLPIEDEEARTAIEEELRRYIEIDAPEKMDGIGVFLSMADGQSEGLKKIEGKIAQKKRAIVRSIDRMYNLVHWAMLKIDRDQIKGEVTTASLCAGRVGGVEVIDESKLPKEYFMVIPAQVVPDFKKIEEALKSKRDVPGARLKKGEDYVRIT